MSEPADRPPWPTPILDDAGLIPERFIPEGVPVRDEAVAELLTREGTATRAAAEGLLGDAVTTAELADTLAGYATEGDLAGYATTTDLNGKADKPLEVVVVYEPGAGWANPTPPAGGWRRFVSVEHIDAPAPPTLAGVDGDRWLPHPRAPIYLSVAGSA